jgi:lysyl-tRNA synthetase, class I
VKRNFESRFVLTHDDRDPLRTIPSKIPNLDGKWHEVTKVMEKELSRYLGMPYVAAPDPFGCCDSWAAHFARVWEDGIYASGVDDIEIYSTDSLYHEGKFEKYIIAALKNIETSRKTIQKFQRTKTSDYVPFDVICENCGKIIGKSTGFDLETMTIKYECSGKDLAGRYTIQGCKHSGETTFDNGKLPWSFEWPAQWAMFSTTFEPFGKEHAEGSWPRCEEICKKIYNAEPPIPHVYEFLLISGKKMSARVGNVYLVQDILNIIEPEIFFYFYTKRSKKQRNLDLENIHLLAEDFEHAERVYFGKNKEKNEREKENLARMYESSVKKIPKNIPSRIDYRFASVIAEACPNDSFVRAIELLKSAGHIKGKLSQEDEKTIAGRLVLSKNWVENFAPPELRIKVNDKLPKIELEENQKKAMSMLAEELKKDFTEEELYSKFYEIAKESGLESKDFFATCYNVLISKNHGPRLAPFIIALGKNRTIDILNQIR